jgi:hypothetical protein
MVGGGAQTAVEGSVRPVLRGGQSGTQVGVRGRCSDGETLLRSSPGALRKWPDHGVGVGDECSCAAARSWLARRRGEVKAP